ncbi:MAG: prolyl-tRNA synthetase associated domain-containing protein [Lachnospiraceae bacterium]|nr:prolyl-tRNA synthetase associated domain-containing protein [Lachnospiraceae bacterium]
MSKFYGKQEVYDLLETKGISFEKMEHEAVYTIEEMNKAGINEKGTVCKNLFLRDAKGQNHYLVTVLEEKRVDLKALAAQIGSTKFSFASEQRLAGYLGVKQGSVSPFGILNDESKSVVVVFDEELRTEKSVGIHPNDNTASVWIAFDDLYKIIEEHGNKVIFAKF